MKIKLKTCNLEEQPVTTADLRKRGYGGIILRNNNQRETIFCLRLENGGVVDISFDDDDIRQLAKQADARVAEIGAGKPATKWESES